MPSRIADDFAAIAASQRELSKPPPKRCTCTSHGKWVKAGAIEMLLPDPECDLHGTANRPQPGGLIGLLDLSEVNWAGLCTEADIDAGRGR